MTDSTLGFSMDYYVLVQKINKKISRLKFFITND